MLRLALLLCGLAALPASIGTAARPTVAILAFDNNTGAVQYDPLGKGIASMMISDLSVLQEIRLLERERIHDVMKESAFQRAPSFDSTTAISVGRLLGAEYVVVGAFTAVKPRLRIDTRVVRVETGEIVKAAQVTGDEDRFFELEQALAKRLLDGLGVALSPEAQARLAAQQEANRVEALSAVADFSRALDRYDAGDYPGAMEHMLPALRASPNSMFMRAALDEMKQRAAASVKERAKDRVKAGIGGLLRRP